MSDDNIKPLVSQSVNLRGNAENAVNKARKESAEAQIKEQVKIIAEHKKGINIAEKKISEIEDDYNAGL